MKELIKKKTKKLESFVNINNFDENKIINTNLDLLDQMYRISQAWAQAHDHTFFGPIDDIYNLLSVDMCEWFVTHGFLDQMIEEEALDPRA